MKHINTSIYTFENLIKGNLLYVDKTQYMYKLVSAVGGQYFLSRPRRFGKSITVSTLDAIFHGKKELFKGLYIYDTDYDWKEHPVIRVDFAAEIVTDIDSINNSLKRTFDIIAESYGVENVGDSPAAMFKNMIYALNEKYGTGVVLLIDEYDKPILDHMNTPEEAEKYRGYMDSFYQVIKGSESMLRFVFITGVTKFAKVSIFSKLNNIFDITMHDDYAAMLGYTEQELVDNFGEYIEAAAEKHGKSFDAMCDDIRRWYDGFKFTDNGENMYNPVSIGSFFNNTYKFENYWFATGTASFLVKLLKKNRLVLSDLECVMISSDSFNTFDVARLASDMVDTEQIMQMLYQTGYLTLDKVVVQEPKMYSLRFPNKEVANSFASNLLNVYAGPRGAMSFVGQIVRGAMDGSTEGMIEALKSFFSGLPYDIQIKSEKYYQSIVYTIFKMCGMNVMTELRTNVGRIDAVMTIADHMYIIEFKLNRSADAALEQIDEKKYADSFILPARESGKTIHKLGINFCCDEDVRNITGWKEEVI